MMHRLHNRRCRMGPCQGGTVKIALTLLIAAYLATGCVAGSNISHEDSPGATKRDAGPALCRDGSTPPCNDRG
jgi:hypothetical protein